MDVTGSGWLLYVAGGVGPPARAANRGRFPIAITIGVLAVLLRQVSPIARFGLLAPAHVHEMSHLLDLAAADMNPSAMATSRGLVRSIDSIVENGETTRIYSFSHSGHALTRRWLPDSPEPSAPVASQL